MFAKEIFESREVDRGVREEEWTTEVINFIGGPTERGEGLVGG